MDLFDILKAANAIHEGHFVFSTDGRHAKRYVHVKSVCCDHSLTEELCRAVAIECMKRGLTIDMVVGPATGGTVLAYETARQIGILSSRKVLTGYTMKRDGTFVLDAPSTVLILGLYTLVLEDNATTRRSSQEVVNAVRRAGGIVTAVAAICDRSDKTTKLVLDQTIPFFSMLQIPEQTWPEEDCPSCKAGIPINTDMGHGAEYLASKKP